jgi:hypothetical protein
MFDLMDHRRRPTDTRPLTKVSFLKRRGAMVDGPAVELAEDQGVVQFNEPCIGKSTANFGALSDPFVFRGV